MKLIPLTKGMTALASDEDFNEVSSFKWHAVQTKGTWYARRSIKGEKANRPKKVYLHRQLLKASPGDQVDHANGNGLDNRRENIRIASSAQNMQNRPVQRNNVSGLKGVHYRKDRGTYRARIVVDGREINLGTYKSPQDASRAYEKASAQYFGQFHRHVV